MSITGGLELIKEMLPILPPSEKKIATYILENPREVISLTSMELGKKSKTSSAAVIRLCKSLKLQGFQDLKIRIAGDLQNTRETRFREIQPNESPVSIIEKTVNNNIQTLRKTAEFINVKELEKAIKLLTNAGTIHFVGVGASGLIAQDAQQKFLRINKTAFAFTDMHLAITQVANTDQEDVVVGISFSGKTTEVAKILHLARRKKAKTISITQYGDSLITEEADVKLYTFAPSEPIFRSGATSSRIAQLQLIDILFMSVVSLQYDEVVRHLDETREAVQFFKKDGKKES